MGALGSSGVMGGNPSGVKGTGRHLQRLLPLLFQAFQQGTVAAP